MHRTKVEPAQSKDQPPGAAGKDHAPADGGEGRRPNGGGEGEESQRRRSSRSSGGSHHSGSSHHGSEDGGERRSSRRRSREGTAEQQPQPAASVPPSSARTSASQYAALIRSGQDGAAEAKAAELMQEAEQGIAIGGTSPSSSARPEGAMQIDVGAGIGAEAVPEPADDVRDRIKSHRSRRSGAPAAATVPFPGSEPPSAAPPAAVAPAPIVPTSEGQGIELAEPVPRAEITQVMRGVSEVVLTGCAEGVGLGLDDQNRVTLLKPGGPAAASGLLGLGDRVVSVDSHPLEGRPLQMVMEQRDKHVFGVEKLGGRPLEEAFPEVARRLSMSDASDGTAGARAHQSSFQGQKVLFSLGRSPRNSAAF